MNRRFAHVLCSLSILIQCNPVCLAAGQPELNFKIYSPQDAASFGSETVKVDSSAPATSAGASDKSDSSPIDSLWNTDSSSTASSPSVPAAAEAGPAADSTTLTTTTSTEASTGDSAGSADSSATGDDDSSKKKLLQGYIRVVPSGTKVPIIMDTAIDTDTSQEGDEFAARTSEDLNIDGATVVPAGSVIKGRIAQMNAPRNLGRTGSVALKFDTVTTPDNRQIPLVANLVARGGVVHAKRGLKDIAIDTGTFALPTALGIGIGALAGSSASSSSSTSGSSMSAGGCALIGAAVGAGVGLVILAVKKGKKVDVRPGDELKIELAEDLRMPM